MGYGFAGAPDQSRIDGIRAEIRQAVRTIERDVPRSLTYDTRGLIGVYDELARMRVVVSKALNQFIEASKYVRHEERQAAWRSIRDAYQKTFEAMRPYRDVIVAARAVLTDTVTQLAPGSPARLKAEAFAKAGGVPKLLALPDYDFRDRVVDELKAADKWLSNTETVRWMVGVGAAGNWIDDLGNAVRGVAALMVDLARTAGAVIGGVFSAIRWVARNWYLPVFGYIGWRVYQDRERSSGATLSGVSVRTGEGRVGAEMGGGRTRYTVGVNGVLYTLVGRRARIGQYVKVRLLNGRRAALLKVLDDGPGS